MNKKQVEKLLKIINGVDFGKITIHKQAGKIQAVKQEKSFKI